MERDELAMTSKAGGVSAVKVQTREEILEPLVCGHGSFGSHEQWCGSIYVPVEKSNATIL